MVGGFFNRTTGKPIKAHQRKIREEKALKPSEDLFGRWWEKIDTDIRKAEVREISYGQANEIIEEYEWLGCMPAMVKVCYGIFFENVCGGAVVFSDEYAENLGVWDKYDFTGKIILLSRGACVHWAHKHSASRLISRAIKLLPVKYKIITATTDELAGEIGTIYQACNFNYVGVMRKTDTRLGVSVNGKLYGSRSIRQKIGTTKKEEILDMFPNAEFIEQKSKSRYFFFRGTKQEKKYHRAQIEKLIKPYPKRTA